MYYKMEEVWDISNPENNGKYRAKAASLGTIHTPKLIKLMSMTSGISSATIKGVLASLEDTVRDNLEFGYDVQLGDLGFLSVSLTSPVVSKKNDIRAESVKFKTLNFRLSRKLRNFFKNREPQRVTRSNNTRSSGLNMTQKEQLLQQHLEANPCISRAHYSRMTGTLRNKAILELNSFIEAGWLKKYGSGRTVVYVRDKG